MGAGSTLRVLRGGSFNNNANNLRAAVRNRNNPENRNNNIGFRVVSSRSSRITGIARRAQALWAEAKNGGKRRLISAAAFRDRVVHHALFLQIEEPFERSFIADSYANRVGKGTHRALDRTQTLARHHRYVLQCDVRQFFPSLDHEVLRYCLALEIGDARVLTLIDLILASGVGILDGEYDMHYFAGDDLFAALRPRGLPIGNLTSQFWANVYMNPFDHFVTRELRCPGYVRYVDDFLLFASDKATLGRWRERLVDRLARLRLTIHDGAHARPVTEGFPFLGFVLFPRRRRLKRRKGIHFARRLRTAIEAHAQGRCSTADVGAMVRGWVNHVRHGDTLGLRRAVLSTCRLCRQTASP